MAEKAPPLPPDHNVLVYVSEYQNVALQTPITSRKQPVYYRNYDSVVCESVRPVTVDSVCTSSTSSEVSVTVENDSVNSEYKPDAIAPPYGWKRLLTNGIIIYVSPTKACLSSVEEVRSYLEADGTCKCGLHCPLHLQLAFSFDPKVITLAAVPAGVEAGRLCQHARRALTTDSLPPDTRCPDVVRRKKKKLLGGVLQPPVAPPPPLAPPALAVPTPPPPLAPPPLAPPTPPAPLAPPAPLPPPTPLLLDSPSSPLPPHQHLLKVEQRVGDGGQVWRDGYTNGYVDYLSVGGQDSSLLTTALPPPRLLHQPVNQSTLVSQAGQVLAQPALHVGQPTLHVSHAGLHVSQPTLHVSQPTLHVSQPTLHVSQPTLHVSQAGVHVNQPTLHVSQAGLHVNQPTLHVSQAGLHVNQPTLHVSQAGLHVSQAGLHVSQAGLHVTQAGLHVSQGLSVSQPMQQFAQGVSYQESTGLPTPAHAYPTLRRPPDPTPQLPPPPYHLHNQQVQFEGSRVTASPQFTLKYATGKCGNQAQQSEESVRVRTPPWHQNKHTKRKREEGPSFLEDPTGYLAQQTALLRQAVLREDDEPRATAQQTLLRQEEEPRTMAPATAASNTLTSVVAGRTNTVSVGSQEQKHIVVGGGQFIIAPKVPPLILPPLLLQPVDVVDDKHKSPKKRKSPPVLLSPRQQLLVLPGKPVIQPLNVVQNFPIQQFLVPSMVMSDGTILQEVVGCQNLLTPGVVVRPPQRLLSPNAQFVVSGELSPVVPQTSNTTVVQQNTTIVQQTTMVQQPSPSYQLVDKPNFILTSADKNFIVSPTSDKVRSGFVRNSVSTQTAGGGGGGAGLLVGVRDSPPDTTTLSPADSDVVSTSVTSPDPSMVHCVSSTNLPEESHYTLDSTTHLPYTSGNMSKHVTYVESSVHQPLQDKDVSQMVCDEYASKVGLCSTTSDPPQLASPHNTDGKPHHFLLY